MADLENALRCFVCSELSTWRARGLSFLISGADVPARRISCSAPCIGHCGRRHGSSRCGSEAEGGGTWWGMDGDLVLQA